MRYTLYYSPATASQVLHWMLIELGESFEAIKVDIGKDEQKSAAYLAINPAGHVPALVVDGRAQAEAAAMLMLLAERDPQGRFDVPPSAPERADYLQGMFYLANSVQPAFRAWFYAHEPAGPEHAEAVKAKARERLETAFARLDAAMADGRTYRLGKRLTALDFMTTMLLRWSRNMPRPATAWPHLKAYADRMRAMPSLIEVHAREGVTDWIGG